MEPSLAWKSYPQAMNIRVTTSPRNDFKGVTSSPNFPSSVGYQLSRKQKIGKGNVGNKKDEKKVILERLSEAAQVPSVILHVIVIWELL